MVAIWCWRIVKIMSWRKIATRLVRLRYLHGGRKISKEEIDELEELRLTLKQTLECLKR